MVEETQRRITDGLDMTAEQRAFLDRVCHDVSGAVQDAVAAHEDGVPHICSEAVEEVVKMTLAAGDFKLPNGQSPRGLLDDHSKLFSGQERLERNQDRILDVVVGPVKTDFLGDPFEDGERDESLGLVAQNAIAIRAAESLEAHMANGGVPVKLPAGIKAAIWTAAGTVIASSVTAAALITAAFIN